MNQQDPKFSTQLELSVRFGKTLLVQELDFIEPILFPLLRGELMRQGPRYVVPIGEKMIDYNNSFQLLMCTRNAYIDLQANSKGLLSIINFTVTKSGLEGKLLSLIINHEQPELEKRKTALVSEEESLKVQLSGLERVLLEELATSQGNILENVTLIDSLNQTKAKSSVIQKSLSESAELQRSLDSQRDVYRMLAAKGASLFILISDLQKINNMYRFSLKMFIKIFNKSLEIEIKMDSQTQKLNYAADNLYKNVFNSVGAALFKSDKLMLGLHIVKGIRPELFESNEWELFIGTSIANLNSNAELPSWCPGDRRESYLHFLSLFPSLINLLQFNEKEWINWFNNNECEKNFPSLYKAKLSSFQKVLVVQVFRPDRVESSLSMFVCEALGLTSISGLIWNFKSILKEEPTPDVPILFVSQIYYLYKPITI